MILQGDRWDRRSEQHFVQRVVDDAPRGQAGPAGEGRLRRRREEAAAAQRRRRGAR